MNCDRIYEKFCELNKIAPEEREIFGRKLKNIVGKDRLIDNQRDTKRDPVTGRRPHIYKGIKVKPEWLDEVKRDKQTSLLTRAEELEGEEEEEEHQQQQNSLLYKH